MIVCLSRPNANYYCQFAHKLHRKQRQPNTTFMKPTNTGQFYLSAQASQHIKLPYSYTNTRRRRNWLSALHDQSSLTKDDAFMNQEEEGDVEFVRTSTGKNNKQLSVEKKSTSSLSDQTESNTSEKAHIFRVEYHKRRLSSSTSSGVCTQNSEDSSSVDNQSLFGKSESIEEKEIADTMQKKQANPPKKPTTLGLAKKMEDASTSSAASKTPIRPQQMQPVIAARRPAALSSLSPTSTAPPPANVFTSEAGEGSLGSGAPGRRRPTSLFMSERFVPSMSSTTPALYTEAEGSKRLLFAFENSGEPATTAPLAKNDRAPRVAEIHPQPHTGFGILGAAVRKLSALQQQRDSDFSLPSSSVRNISAEIENIGSELFSPTARGGTLTASSPSTIRAFQSIAELASPTGNVVERSDPIRMVAAAAAKTVQNFPSTLSGADSEQSTVKTLTPNELASKMTRPRPFLLLDCRSALAFNRLHIIGAANINCGEKSSRKRLQLGRTVSDLISSKETRALFRKRIMRDVIVYDDATQDVAQLPPSDPLLLVISALRSDGKVVSLLSGGFNSFQSQHNHLCEQTTTESSRQQQFLLPSLLSLESYGSSTPSTPGYEESEVSTPISATLPSTPSGISGGGRFLTAQERRLRAAEQEPREDDAERAEVSQILRGLYLGNERDAGNFDRLQQLKITHVVNITTHIPCHHLQRGITYLRLPASDSPRQDLLQHFAEAFDFIDKARREEGNVLVHCQAGISRSATITVSYIMRACGLSMQEAYKLVKQKRSVISPNLNFMGQLYEYEKSLTALAATVAEATAISSLPSSSSTVISTKTDTVQHVKMECDNNGGGSSSTSSRPNSGKLSMMVTQSIFEKKSSSAVMSPRSSVTAGTTSRQQHIAERPYSNKRPSDQDYNSGQSRYPSRAVKRPMSLKLSAPGDEDWQNSTKSAPNTLQNEEETEEARQLTFAGFHSAAEASGDENTLLSIHQSSSAAVIGTSSPTNGSKTNTPKKIRSPLTPTNDYPTLVITTSASQQQATASNIKSIETLPSNQKLV